jgi:hypothetical protein
VAGSRRLKSELLTPSENCGQFQHLSLEDFAMFAVPDGAWDQYGPSVASALDCSADARAVRASGDRLERRVRQSVAINPAPLEIKAHVMVFAKR